MTRKEILTIILLICVIFSLQAVVAADSGSNSTDSNTLSVEDVSAYALPSSDTDSLAVEPADSFTDLQGIVNGASTTDTINLTRNYTYKGDDQGSNGINISNKTITLDVKAKSS